jgi:hypothetical protein
MAVAYILKRVPSKSIPSTPYELWSGKKPDLSNLCPWGCACYVHNATHKHGKLGPRQINVYLSDTLMNLNAM